MMKTGIVEGDGILRGLFLKLMAVNILIGLVQPCNQFVDSILTGQGLGLAALEAFALFQPFGALMTALSTFLAIGTQISCSHMLGSGRFNETKTLLQTAFLSALVVSLLFTVVLYGFSSQIAVLLGARADVVDQVRDTADYLLGYAPGIPAIFLISIMMSLIQLEGKKKLVILMSLGIFFINGAGDLVNLFILKQGLFGMAAATAVANIVICIILMIYFLSMSKMFRFSLLGFRKSHLFSIFRNGLPSLSYYGSIVVRTAFLNMLILMNMDGDILAIMVVVNSFVSVIDAAIGGPGDATLLLGGILYGQKDIKGLRKLLKISLSASACLLLVISILTVAFALPLAGLFSGNSDTDFISATANAIRLTALSFVVDVLACVLKKYIQSVGRAVYTSFTNILCNVVYECLVAWFLVTIIGSDGIFLSFTVCYVLVLVTHIIYAVWVSRYSGRSGFDCLLFLPKDCKVSGEDQWVYSINDMDGCIMASKQVNALCRERGVDERKIYLMSLIAEELTTNVVTHGFRYGNDNIIVIKLIFIADRIILNIQDNGTLFDPVRYYESLRENKEIPDGIGISLVMKLAKNIVYTSSFSLNNIMVEV